MNQMITETRPDTLHRGVKMALDNGEAASVEAAYALFASYRVAVGLGAGAGQSAAMQAALLTMVNCGRRALLGGVEVLGDIQAPLLVDLPGLGLTLQDAVVALGGTPQAEPSRTRLVWLGEGAPAGALQVTFGDWRGDDGGFSGGSLDRPAVHKLLADIRDRRIDVVVVYKVDRLTRSLADFAKLVELFDGHGVSFVSVTQSFNTTSSMGRLTLNVLLSFAQFEREVTGERIRDKIAASKRKGIWVGGTVPFGYALQDRKLVVDEAEAAIVRLIFERYLVLGSLPALQRELRERGILTRQRPMRSGVIRGGVALTNGPLQHMLRNRVYRGELNHRGASYPAEHQPIVAADLFAEVQARLDANRRAHTARRQHSDALLTGLLFDDQGHRMSPSFAIKNGMRYRYYVSAMLVQGRRTDAGSVSRLSAQEIEDAVIAALTGAGHALPRPLDRDGLAAVVERITVGPGRLEIRTVAVGAAAAEPIVISWSPRPLRPKRGTIAAAGGAATGRSMRSAARARLLVGIARARCWLDAMMTGAVADVEMLAQREGLSERAVRMTLSLAFVAPDIVEAAADGTLPRGFGLSRLTDLSPSWHQQRRTLGIARQRA